MPKRGDEVAQGPQHEIVEHKGIQTSFAHRFNPNPPGDQIFDASR
jgi:hypothetical protein